MATNPKLSPAEKRAAYIAGVRALADLLEANPHLIIPSTGSGDCGAWSVQPQNREQMQAWVDALDTVERQLIRDNFVSIGGHVGALAVSVFTSARFVGRQVTRERVTTEFEVEPFTNLVTVSS